MKAFLITLAAAVLGLLLVVAALFTTVPSAFPPATTCGPGALTVSDGPVPGLDDVQAGNARTVIAVGVDLGIPEHGLVIAIAVGLTESGLRNLPSQAVPLSLLLPHDTYPDGSIPAGDHDSVGVFQQRANWASVRSRMVVEDSARWFYTGGDPSDGYSEPGLLDVDGWESMPVTVAAQTVQVSAYPTAYAAHEADAEAIVAAVTSGTSTEPVEGTDVPVGGYNLGPVTPQLEALVGILAPMFGITVVGGYRDSATDPNGHPAGLAADFMTDSQAQGDALAAYAQEHAVDLGVDYIIWWQRIWSVERADEGWRPMEDRGGTTENHYDHVHINVYPDGVVVVPADAEALCAPGAVPIATADCAAGQVTLATINAQGISDSIASTTTSVEAGMEGVTIGLFQEVPNVNIRRILPPSMGVHQLLTDHGSRSSAVAWDTSCITSIAEGQAVGTPPNPMGTTMSRRLLTWNDVSISGDTTIRVVATHRPPGRYRRTWPMYDRALARFVEASPYPLIIGVDSNSPTPVQWARGFGLAWVGHRIDGFAYTPSLTLSAARTGPDTPSDHFPVYSVLTGTTSG